MHFGLELYTRFLRNDLLYMQDQGFDIRGRSRTGIDDEIGMFFRYPGTAQLKTLESRRLDKAGSMITGRISERRTGTG